MIYIFMIATAVLATVFAVIARGDFLADLDDEIDVVRRKYKVKPLEVNIPEGAIHIEN